MTNLIFDLNNIAYRSLFIIGGFGTSQYTFDSQSELDQLVRKMSTDVAFLIRLINPSRVIFAKDDKSWRKNIAIDENEGYKGQRVKSGSINWNNVYNSIDDFCNIMISNGMIVTKVNNAEADDLAHLWANELQINQKQHVIIVSGDEDLRQLVNYNSESNTFTLVFNPFMQGKNASRKLYVPEYFNEWINTADVVDFMNLRGTINVDKEDFKKIITAEKTKAEVVDGTMVALRKVFCGDDGDNIPAIFTWLSDKGVETRVTNSKFEKIYESLLTTPNERLTHKDIFERADKVMVSLQKVTKQVPPFNIKDRLERQIKLVVLDKDFFPTQIIKDFEKTKQEQLDRSKVNYSNLNMHNLLEGTRYVRDKKTENEASIFKQIDRIRGTQLF